MGRTNMLWMDSESNTFKDIMYLILSDQKNKTKYVNITMLQIKAANFLKEGKSIWRKQKHLKIQIGHSVHRFRFHVKAKTKTMDSRLRRYHPDYDQSYLNLEAKQVW